MKRSLLILMWIILAFALLVSIAWPRKKKENKDNFSIGQYVYLDSRGVLHVKSPCVLGMEMIDDEGNSYYKSIKFIDTAKVDESLHSVFMCPWCVDDVCYRQLKEIAERHKKKVIKKTEWLYNALKKGGYKGLGDLDYFSKMIVKQKYKERSYSALRLLGYTDIGYNEDDFAEKMGLWTTKTYLRDGSEVVMNNNEVKKLYTALLDKGYSTYDLGDEETFRTKMSDKNNRKELYDWISSKGNFRLGDYDIYESRLTSPSGDIFRKKMNGQEYVKKTYDIVSERYDAGDFDTFRQKMQEEETARKVYGIVSEKYDAGDFSEFCARLELKPKKNTPLKSEAIPLRGASSYAPVPKMRDNMLFFDYVDFFNPLPGIPYFIEYMAMTNMKFTPCIVY